MPPPVEESRQPPPSAEMNADNMKHNAVGEYKVPSESELVLLSLDYLRDLRRAYANKEDLLHAEGLDADWLTVAIFALNRAFAPPNKAHGDSLFLDNDAWKADAEPEEYYLDRLPSLERMTEEVVYSRNPNLVTGGGNSSLSGDFGILPNPTLNDPKDEDLEAFAWYEYDDAHPSNQHRYYLLNGFGGASRGPLFLGEIAAAGLKHLQARSRSEAEKEMVATPLFDQFLQAVKSKGFFKDPANDSPMSNPIEEKLRIERKETVYQARYQKVVAKFRNKLAFKADPMGEDGSDQINLSDEQYTRRLRNCLGARKDRHVEEITKTCSTAVRLQPGSVDPQDLQEAERLKNVGNAHMQHKDYPAAAAAYTQALRLSPTGPNSHVYFSNRAAALLSMKQFQEAIADSERSLALKPNYGKAHARLGLAHFLLGDYKQAIKAYTVALKYEPENKSSQSYLEKATKRLAKQDEQSIMPGSSFSVVSEWEKSHTSGAANHKTGGTTFPPHPVAFDQREAEKSKVLGNQFMAQRQYQEALEAYSKAIEYSPSGAQSHVYYSNRAAALCYLERYEEAAKDSQTSIQMKPDYGKAHARLGLSRFFLGDYLGAIQSYTAALNYDPNNAASKSYLAKAKLKWEQQGHSASSNPARVVQPAILDEDARRLMNDPDMQTVAKRAMATSPSSCAQLLEDPEMVRIARKAVQDPSMMAAVKAVVNH